MFYVQNLCFAYIDADVWSVIMRFEFNLTFDKRNINSIVIDFTFYIFDKNTWVARTTDDLFSFLLFRIFCMNFSYTSSSSINNCSFDFFLYWKSSFFSKLKRFHNSFHFHSRQISIFCMMSFHLNFSWYDNKIKVVFICWYWTLISICESRRL